MNFTLEDGAVIFEVTGEQEPIVGDYSLEDLKKRIDCDNIEIVESIDGGYLIIDDCGKLKNKAINIEGTLRYKYSRVRRGGHSVIVDVLVGDVIYMPSTTFLKFDNSL